MLTLANQVPTISPNYTRVELDLIHAIGYSVVVAGIMVALWLCVGLLVWLDRRRLYAPALRSDTPQPSLADRNRREVIGWQLASEKELNSFSPEKLQALLDSRNPFSDRITACEVLLKEGAEPTGSYDTSQKLKQALWQLRRAPLEINAARVADEADELLASIRLEIDTIVPKHKPD